MAKHSVPKKKSSRARGNRRYKAFQNDARVRLSEGIQLMACKNCKATVRRHHICQECGFYGEKDVMGHKKPESKVKTIKAE